MAVSTTLQPKLFSSCSGVVRCTYVAGADTVLGGVNPIIQKTGSGIKTS